MAAGDFCSVEQGVNGDGAVAVVGDAGFSSVFDQVKASGAVGESGTPRCVIPAADFTVQVELQDPDFGDPCPEMELPFKVELILPPGDQAR